MARGSARRGRDKLAAPGKFLAIASGIGLVLLILGLISSLTGMDGSKDTLDQLVAQAKAEPPGPGRDDRIKMLQWYLAITSA